MQNKHTIDELRLLQALPLDVKVAKTKLRIREWVNHYGIDGVYVSFSGGKDSTVLLHLARELYPEIVGVYSDTGLEFPEIREFVKTIDNIVWVKPDLNDGGYDATLTGFDVSEMSDLFDDQSEIKEDDPPEAAAEDAAPFTKPGDRWLLGNHVLYCGDSTSSADVAALMDGAVADLCVTDPPYNVAYEGSNGLTIQNDNMPEETFLAFLKDAFRCMHDALKPGAPFYIWHAETEGGAFRTATNAALGKVRQMLIWNKNSFTMGHQDYQWKHEACIYGWTDGATHYFVDDRTQATVIEDKRIDINKLKKEEMRELLRDIFSDKTSTTVIDENKPARNADHPTMKPLKLLARLIKNSSKQGDIVLDTFGGSGSTLITCEQLGRRCYTMELDPRYADVIVKRYQKFAGKSSVILVRNGKKSNESLLGISA